MELFFCLTHVLLAQFCLKKSGNVLQVALEGTIPWVLALFANSLTCLTASLTLPSAGRPEAWVCAWPDGQF
jgi:hypothetical protein